MKLSYEQKETLCWLAVIWLVAVAVFLVAGCATPDRRDPPVPRFAPVGQLPSPDLRLPR
jgi:uncharacterized lipoprotein YajG